MSIEVRPYPEAAKQRKLHWQGERYTPENDTRLILDLIGNLKAPAPAVICEIGCNRGITTFELATAFPRSLILAIDHYRVSMCAEQQAERPKAEDVCFLAASFPNVLPILKDMDECEPVAPVKLDVVFIDGDHTFDGCLRDTKWAINSGARLIIWHDCYEKPPTWVGVHLVVEQFGGHRYADSGVAALFVRP